MYHSLKRVFAAAVIAAAVVLSGCTGAETAKITIDKSEYETDTSTVYAERPVFSFMDNKELQDRLNDEYEKEVSSMMVEFDNAGGEPLEGGNKRVLEITQEVKNNSGRILSVLSEVYNYSGGAHGQSARTARNVDTVTGADLTLDDLFSDAEYKKVLNRLIEEEVESNPDEYSDLWEKPEIKDSNKRDFYLSGDSLVIFYQPYDLSYYARGFVEFAIDFEDIESYLKPEYTPAAG